MNTEAGAIATGSLTQRSEIDYFHLFSSTPLASHRYRWFSIVCFNVWMTFCAKPLRELVN